ncbi:hypothetical protein B0H12DRAFT_275524 [Mycena haematopus]|nr:hypothetical protein B0H12DRAFT_275524 [Mycena haematopus]
MFAFVATTYSSGTAAHPRCFALPSHQAQAEVRRKTTENLFLSQRQPIDCSAISCQVDEPKMGHFDPVSRLAVFFRLL